MRSNQPRSAHSKGRGSRDQRLLLCQRPSPPVRSNWTAHEEPRSTSGGLSIRHADRRRSVSELHCPDAHDLWPDVSRTDTGAHGDRC